jgi:hypothetical protein
MIFYGILTLNLRKRKKKYPLEGNGNFYAAKETGKQSGIRRAKAKNPGGSFGGYDRCSYPWDRAGIEQLALLFYPAVLLRAFSL